MRYRYRAVTTNALSFRAEQAGVFVVISGSASRTRIIRRIKLSAFTIGTTLRVFSIVARKFSSPPTGGTASALTRVPVDAKFPAAATDGLVQVYVATGAPTDGTLVGVIACKRVLFKSSTLVDGAECPEDEVEFCFVPKRKRFDVSPYGIYLHGTEQAVGLAFVGGPPATVAAGLEVEWDEEAGP